MKWFLLVAALWLVLLFGGLWLQDQEFHLKMRPNEWGDLLAGAFGPLAFLGIVGTIILQGKQLSAQLAELAAQREELAGSRKVLTQQVDKLGESVLVRTTQVDTLEKLVSLSQDDQLWTNIYRQAQELAIRFARDADRLIVHQINDASSTYLIGNSKDLKADLNVGPSLALATIRRKMDTAIQRLNSHTPGSYDNAQFQRVHAIIANLSAATATFNSSLLPLEDQSQTGELRKSLDLMGIQNRIETLQQSVARISSD